MLKINKGEITSWQEVAEEFRRFFLKIVGVVNEAKSNTTRGMTQDLMRDARPDLSSRKLKLQSLDPNKACGAGEIGSKLLQMVAIKVSPLCLVPV